MGLFFPHNRDHALLALVVKKTRAMQPAEEPRLGRTAIQKMIYFLRVLGVPVNYRFELFNYGPFCQNIMQDMDTLLFDGVLEDRADNQTESSDYYPGGNIDELLSDYRKELNEYTEDIRQVVKLATLRSTQLELLATLDYIFRQEKAPTRRERPIKERVISRFLEVKGDKFGGESSVSKTYDKMNEIGLFKID